MHENSAKNKEGRIIGPLMASGDVMEGENCPIIGCEKALHRTTVHIAYIAPTD